MISDRVELANVPGESTQQAKRMSDIFDVDIFRLGITWPAFVAYIGSNIFLISSHKRGYPLYNFPP
jgi:hypothetical protein